MNLIWVSIALARDRSKNEFFARLLSEPYMLPCTANHPLADKDHHVVQDLHRQGFPDVCAVRWLVRV